MIGFLEGKVKYSEPGKIILYTNGIGFNIFTPTSVSSIPGGSTALYIHTHLREDNLSLYGFTSPEDLSLFEKLISVSGVGPRSALAIFSASSAENITNAITQSNLAFFTSVSGIGKKSAQKIILDLKSKIGKGDVDISRLEGNSELVDSLIALGFQKHEIQTIASQIDSSRSISDQVKTALKLLKK